MAGGPMPGIPLKDSGSEEVVQLETDGQTAQAQ